MGDFTGNTPVFIQTGDYDNGIFNITLSAALTRYICVTQPVPSATGGMSICELRVFGGNVIGNLSSREQSMLYNVSK